MEEGRGLLPNNLQKMCNLITEREGERGRERGGERERGTESLAVHTPTLCVLGSITACKLRDRGRQSYSLHEKKEEKKPRHRQTSLTRFNHTINHRNNGSANGSQMHASSLWKQSPYLPPSPLTQALSQLFGKWLGDLGCCCFFIILMKVFEGVTENSLARLEVFLCVWQDAGIQELAPTPQPHLHSPILLKKRGREKKVVGWPCLVWFKHWTWGWKMQVRLQVRTLYIFLPSLSSWGAGFEQTNKQTKKNPRSRVNGFRISDIPQRRKHTLPWQTSCRNCTNVWNRSLVSWAVRGCCGYGLSGGNKGPNLAWKKFPMKQTTSNLPPPPPTHTYNLHAHRQPAKQTQTHTHT